MTKNITSLIRKNIQKLEGYSCAQDEYDLNSDKVLLLNANENPYNLSIPDFEIKKINYYPNSNQKELRQTIAKFRGVDFKNIICGNGSDEIIDQLIRIFCEPKQDSICVCPPTFGMYEVCGNLNEIEIEKISLISKNTKSAYYSTDKTIEMTLDVKEIIASKAKILFFPNPAAPTGGLFEKEQILEILEKFEGIVVIDEAYVDFAKSESFISQIKNFSNLVVLETFSKFWGLAGARIGMCFATQEIIEKIETIKMPYSINQNSQILAINAVKNYKFWREKSDILVAERQKLEEFLLSQTFVSKVFKSDANFVYFQTVSDKIATEIYQKLLKNNIVIRSFSGNKLRISIGKPDEMEKVRKYILGNTEKVLKS